MHDIARPISEALHFDVSGLFDILLYKATTISKCIECFVGRLCKESVQIFVCRDDADPTSTTSHEGCE